MVCSFCSTECFPFSISPSVAFQHYKLTQQHSKQGSELECWTVSVESSISTVEIQIEGISQLFPATYSGERKKLFCTKLMYYI